jgi:riboflavin transporter FmnP
MAMLVAVAVVLVLTIHIKVIDPFEYDPGDVPVLIGGFLFGPLAGLAITAVAAVIQGLTVSASSGIWGIVMHIVSTGTFVVVASLIYHRQKTIKGALMGLICGALATVLIMIPANLIVSPIWYQMPRQAVAEMLLPVIVPFNAIKVVINGLVTFFIYKPISKLVKKDR